ncbi:hypothetical protein [Nocardioides sp.]|uniref:hypothetical protein n=1 Tax=Nocardioides sp. TaxID=35761 RepID=UPI0035669F39
MPTDDDLGPMPEPQVEHREANPGGVDAIDGGAVDAEAPAIPDLSPDSNPAVDSEPLEMKESEDTSTEATKDGETERDGNDSDESPA